jgi:hypothetical protein
MEKRETKERPGFAGPFRALGVGAISGPHVQTVDQIDNTGALGYKVRVLSPFPAMETYADH